MSKHRNDSMVEKTYILAGVRYVICKPQRAPKQITANPIGTPRSDGSYRAGRSGNS